MSRKEPRIVFRQVVVKYGDREARVNIDGSVKNVGKLAAKAFGVDVPSRGHAYLVDGDGKRIGLHHRASVLEPEATYVLGIHEGWGDDA